MRTVVRAALQSILNLTRTLTQMFDACALRQNCNTSPGLARPVGSSYEDYSVTKDMEEILIEVRLAKRKG